MNLPDNALVLPLIMAVSGLPVLVAAVLVARGNLRLINGLDAARLRDPAAAAARFARLLALVAISMFLAALGFYWAHGDYNRILVVTVLLLVSVNGLAATMLIALSRLKRDYRAPRDDPRTGRR
ncbi:hypothetical protein [Lysobacter enzymogenes]|uniref:Uncharacterized protein n=1 Tax=Lysobacter enzymogenes TaxID=69 RepID=A0A0S2DET6_LYSEN|nr:hypothetical protein [Lysobacter enzymogenes]ALN56944.1 hypothetical protein GLE_1587 [Lysobacter enzymogenes]QCW25663.1 hypothetical protein FE772_08260 [Lysobacter enzymogenes]QQP99813.1 hypothetical protein JHW41_17075 [Lysobacter enzymogenes]